LKWCNDATGALPDGVYNVFVIRLYLVGHAAEKKAGGTCVLTQRGKRRFRRLARAFARLGEPIALVCTSPKSHARETAEILARALGRRPALVLDELEPRASADSLLVALAALRPSNGEMRDAFVGLRKAS